MRRYVAVALAALALVVTGCSVSSPKAPKTTASAPTPGTPDQPVAQYISDVTLKKLPSDSPEHAVLLFWQDVQYKNLLHAYSGLAKDFKREFAGSLPHFTKYISADFQHWLTAPKVLFTKEKGSTATVALSYKPPGFPTADRSIVALKREGGKWRVAYYFYLASRLRGQ